jgi:hypothetical protein
MTTTCRDKNNIDRALIPFTIENNSGSTDPIYVYLFGTTNPDASTHNTYYLSDLNGDCTLFPPNTTELLGLPLDGTKVSACLPQLDGIRVYISIGKQLTIEINDEGLPSAVSADVPGNPNYNTLWDFVEATWHDYVTHTILHVNTTQVDAFGIAFKVTHSGYDPADPSAPLTVTNGFDSNTARAEIFKDFASAGAPWSNLVISDAGGPLRALGPVKAIDRGLFPTDQLDAYIKQVVAFYDASTSNRLIFPYAGVTYRGRTEGDAFVFAPDQSADGQEYKIEIPSTRNCYAQDIQPTAGTGGAISAALGASFLRSTLVFYPDAGFPVPQESRSLYYTKPPICEYARILHNYGIDHHAFCYGYDEVAGDAGGNRDVRNPTSFTLTINGL